MSFLLYKHTDDSVFEDFPKISDHFPKISEDFPKLFQRPDKRSRTVSENSRKFPKMSEDFRRLSKTIEEDPKMFRWHTNYFKYNLRDKLDISEIIDIFTCEDIVSFLRICYHSVYQWLLYNKMAYMAQSAPCLTSFYCAFCSLVVFMLTGTGVSGVENPAKLSTDETLTTCFTWVKIYGRTKYKKRQFCDSMRYKLLSGPFLYSLA